jgi:protein TonB
MEEGEFFFRKEVKVKPSEWWFSILTFMPEKWAWQLERRGDSTVSRLWRQQPDAGFSDTVSVLDQTMPEIISKGRPRYPSKARYFGQSCVVTVKVLVSTEGSPLKVLIQTTGDPEWRLGFNEAAIVGAKECKFKPATQNGKPVNVWVSFPFEFELRGR